MGGARHFGRDAGHLRRRAIDCSRHHRYGDVAAHREPAEGRERHRGGCPMTFDPGMPMVPEVALFALAVLVLSIGLVRRGDSGHVIGWITLIGLLATLGVTFAAREGATLFGGSFVNDSLAIFSKKLFVSAAALSVLASLTLGQ